MHLARLRLRDFRNYARLDAEFAPGFHVLLGRNAQGKTNLLEAIYLAATLRSFRGAGGHQLLRHGQQGYFIGARAVGQATREIGIYWSAAERRLTLDRQKVRRLADYLGTLRAVVFCAEDLQLVKGTARVRRRFMDLLLAQTQPGYLAWLLRYLQAVRSRNAVLKRMPLDEALLEGFTDELVRAGEPIIAARQRLVPQLAPLAQSACQSISSAGETLELSYQPQVRGELRAALEAQRARERVRRATLVGPHLDELMLLLQGRPAATFASEGQKRTLALALKMAQAEFLTGAHGVPPILLIDDVMGELDQSRRAGLLPLLERAQHARGQVFMTCTEESWPRELGRALLRWEVAEGALKAVPA